MGNLHGRMPTQTINKQQHDKVEERQRVATHADGNTVSYEDTNFTTGESPAVLNVLTDLGRAGHKGSFINDGPGDVQIELSYDGTVYGGLHTLRGGETLSLHDLKIAKIRVTYIDPTEYRCLIA